MIKPRSSKPSAAPDAPGSTSERKASELSTAIGDELRALYDSVATEPIPDKFRALIEELERKSGKTRS